MRPDIEKAQGACTQPGPSSTLARAIEQMGVKVAQLRLSFQSRRFSSQSFPGISREAASQFLPGRCGPGGQGHQDSSGGASFSKPECRAQTLGLQGGGGFDPGAEPERPSKCPSNHPCGNPASQEEHECPYSEICEENGPCWCCEDCEGQCRDDI